MSATRFLFFSLYLYQNYNFTDAFNFKLHPDVGLNIPQLLNKYGYPAEIHNIVTEDGYMIKIFRIPYGKNVTRVHKYPVLLVPGTCGCSENFIITGPEKAIAYYLSDGGFDVWLANTRGNRHARKHKYFNSDKDKIFWNFGWHEVAIYDTPALVDYVLNFTNSSQLFYIGHSQGTTSFFAFAAEKPEYNKKIRLSIQMAPSCLLGDTRTLVKVLGKHSLLIEQLAKILNIYVLFPQPINDVINYLGRILCADMTFFVDICYLIIYFINYSSNNLVDPEDMQLIMQTSPAGCSLKELLHYFQIVYSGEFRKYDYGRSKNFKYYGQENPPWYNLSRVTSPVSLFMAESDNLVPAKGVQQLSKLLPNLESIYKISHSNFNHVDFIFSNITKKLVNKPIYDLFMKYVKKR